MLPIIKFCVFLFFKKFSGLIIGLQGISFSVVGPMLTKNLLTVSAISLGSSIILSFILSYNRTIEQ